MGLTTKRLMPIEKIKLNTSVEMAMGIDRKKPVWLCMVLMICKASICVK
jgi:hypothetical protein